MSLLHRFDWQSNSAPRKQIRSRKRRRVAERRLRFEPLEDRRVLAAVVGVDFGFNDGIAANQTAGVVARANWNNAATGPTGTVSNLVNDSNQATTIDVDWTSNNTFTVSSSAAADGNAAIFKGYLDTSNVSVTTVNLAQIPFALYDVYVYFDGGAADGRSGKYTIDTSTLAPITQGQYLDNANWPVAAGGGSFVLADAPGEAGNYMVFSGLTGASFALTATPFGGPTPRAPVNAIQIVERALQVDTTADVVDGNYSPGQLSLREAIQLANALPAADTITFAASLTSGGPATIVLTQGQLTISNSVTIVGPGSNLLTIDASGNDPTPTIDDGNGSRVLNIDNLATSFIDVAISGLTITGGDVSNVNGGGILSRENLTISDSLIAGNSARSNGGGIRQEFGRLIVERSVIKQNNTSFGAGGGICSDETGVIVQINDSTISDNRASFRGGGLSFSRSLATVMGSTISHNEARTDGGGISVDSDSTLTVRHSTIVSNLADRGANGFGDGGGIRVFFGTAALEHTIVAGNTNGDVLGPVADDISQYISSSSVTASYSVIGVNTNATITDSDGNLIGTSAAPIDPKLGPLADNGGPTHTHALLPGSPAIDAGNAAIRANVARGGSVTQSSEYGSSEFPAGNALDGNTSNYTHTSTTDPNPSWQVTMLTDFAVSRVVLHNREGNWSRLRDITIEILDAAGTVVATSPLLNAENYIGGGQLDVGPTTLTFDVMVAKGAAVLGRSIRVRRTPDPDLSGSSGGGNEGEPNVLSLAEVEVFAVDQRGAGFNRVVDGNLVNGARIDIGAYESQGAPIGLPTGDYNRNGAADAADYVLWRKTLGQTGANLAADGDRSGASENKIDQADYTHWRAHFGNTTVPLAAGGGAGNGTGAAAAVVAVEELARDGSGAGGVGALSYFVEASTGNVRRAESSRTHVPENTLAVADKTAGQQLLLAIDAALAGNDRGTETPFWYIDMGGASGGEELAATLGTAFEIACANGVREPWALERNAGGV